MKKIYLFSIIALIAILFSSCGSSVIVKNSSTEIDGTLKGYLEVVDSSYKVSMDDNKLKLTLKLKAIKPLDEDIEFEDIWAKLLDESGESLSGVGFFYLSKDKPSDDTDKVDNALKEGRGEFDVQLVYSPGSLFYSDEEALKIALEEAKSFSLDSQTMLSSNSSK